MDVKTSADSKTKTILASISDFFDLAINCPQRVITLSLGLNEFIKRFRGKSILITLQKVSHAAVCDTFCRICLSANNIFFAKAKSNPGTAAKGYYRRGIDFSLQEALQTNIHARWVERNFRPCNLCHLGWARRLLSICTWGTAGTSH